MAAFLPPDLLSGLAPPAAGREPPRAHPIGGASGRPPRRPWHNSFARRPFVAQYLRNPRREFPAGSRPPDAPPEMLLAPRFPRGVRLKLAGDFPLQEALSSIRSVRIERPTGPCSAVPTLVMGQTRWAGV